MEKIEYVWHFVQKYYPDYDHCEEITRESDLFKLIEKEYEEGDDAHTMLVEDYNGNINNPEIYKDWRGCLCQIYEEAIKGYIEQQ